MKVSDRRGQGAALAAALGVAILLAGWAMLNGTRVRAQEKAPDKTEATAIVADLDDIERLRVLNPLKLQPEQLDKLITALTSAQTEYDKKVNALGASIFVPLGSEVRDVRKKALGGSSIPKDFDDKLKKAQTDFLKQRDDLNTENIKSVAAACKMVFTDKQVTAATKMERDQWNKDHPDIKDATDTQLFNLYCVDVLISNPRSISLLKEIRAAQK